MADRITLLSRAIIQNLEDERAVRNTLPDRPTEDRAAIRQLVQTDVAALQSDLEALRKVSRDVELIETMPQDAFDQLIQRTKVQSQTEHTANEHDAAQADVSPPAAGSTTPASQSGQDGSDIADEVMEASEPDFGLSQEMRDDLDRAIRVGLSRRYQPDFGLSQEMRDDLNRAIRAGLSRRQQDD